MIRTCLTALALAIGLTLSAGLPPAGADEPAVKPQPKPASHSEQAKPAKKEAKPTKKKDPYAWTSMFDGKTLGKWKVPNFGGQGEVYVKDGAIVMEMGDSMTGITWTGPLPKINYEVELEARRTNGIDFFATTTFPVGNDPCSFVVGGWAGTVIGLSCVDWYDASDNITTDFMNFEDKKWYKIRIRVTKQRVECWIGNDKKVDLATKDHKFSIRDEVDLCRPFGISTWCTEGQVRKLRIRRLSPQEVAKIPAKDRWE